MDLPGFAEITIGDHHFRSWNGFIEVAPNQETTSPMKSVRVHHATCIFPKLTTVIGYDRTRLLVGNMSIEMPSEEEATKAYRWIGERLHI